MFRGGQFSKVKSRLKTRVSIPKKTSLYKAK